MQPVNRILTLGAAAVGGGLVARALLRRSRYRSVAGQVVLITGGSRGLGLLLARECARRGARIAICARDEAELYRARDELRLRGADVLAVQCDVTIRQQVDELVDGTLRHFGSIDFLINNAGIITVAPVEQMTIDDYEQSLRTHLGAPVYMAHAVLPYMKARGTGRIINITSIGGKVPAPHLLPYTAGKFALVGFSEGLRAELLKDNIYVTTVVPGLMRTGSPRHARFKGHHTEEYAWFTTADVLPVLSINAARAARRIINAAEHGDAEVIFPWPAMLQAKLHGLMPGLTTDLAGLFNRMLPPPGGLRRVAMPGAASRSDAIPEFAQRRTDEAARAHNEMPPP